MVVTTDCLKSQRIQNLPELCIGIDLLYITLHYLYNFKLHGTSALCKWVDERSGFFAGYRMNMDETRCLGPLRDIYLSMSIALIEIVLSRVQVAFDFL